MSEMGLVYTLRNRPLKKKEQAKLSLKNDLRTILFCPPSNYSLFSSVSVAPGQAKVIEGKAGEAHRLPVPGRNGSRKRKSSQKLPRDPVEAGAGFLVLEASSNGTSKSRAKLSRWCAPRRQDCAIG